MNLSDAVAMFPTVTTREYKGGRKTETLAQKGRKPSNSLCDFINSKQFATPQARDFRTGQAKRYHDKNRSRNLNDQICAMFATPCAGDSVGTNGGGNGTSLRTDIGGQLNPDWVDWLMGFPVGWTNIELDMPLPDYDPQYFDTEPNVPRTATGIKNRVDRIICDGNAVVPYQAYPIFKAIAELEEA